jgi:hypothetical protein
MTQLIMPDVVATQLQGLPHPVHLCDAAGKTLGYFLPVVDPSQYEIVGPQPSREELDQTEKFSKWYTTDEVLRNLESLG